MTDISYIGMTHGVKSRCRTRKFNVVVENSRGNVLGKQVRVAREITSGMEHVRPAFLICRMQKSGQSCAISSDFRAHSYFLYIPPKLQFLLRISK
jgi:hypothetical protein